MALARYIAQQRPEAVHTRVMQRTVRLDGLRTADDIHTACHALIDAAWLLPGAKPHGKARNRAAYPINPALWSALEQASEG